MINIQKAAVIGCGFVGSSIAYALMQKGTFSELVTVNGDLKFHFRLQSTGRPNLAGASSGSGRLKWISRPDALFLVYQFSPLYTSELSDVILFLSIVSHSERPVSRSHKMDSPLSLRFIVMKETHS